MIGASQRRPCCSEDSWFRDSDNLNCQFVLGYVTLFSGDLPAEKEVKVALKWANNLYRLSPTKTSDHLEEWLDTEVQLQLAFATSVCNSAVKRNAARRGNDCSGSAGGLRRLAEVITSPSSEGF